MGEVVQMPRPKLVLECPECGWQAWTIWNDGQIACGNQDCQMPVEGYSVYSDDEEEIEYESDDS